MTAHCSTGDKQGFLKVSLRLVKLEPILRIIFQSKRSEDSDFFRERKKKKDVNTLKEDIHKWDSLGWK